jgi:hypothetical protein
LLKNSISCFDTWKSLIANPSTFVFVAGPRADLVGAGLAIFRLARRSAGHPGHAAAFHHRFDLGALLGRQVLELFLHFRHRVVQLTAHAIDVGLRHLAVALAAVVDQPEHLLRAIEDHGLRVGLGAHPLLLDLNLVGLRVPARCRLLDDQHAVSRKQR